MELFYTIIIFVLGLLFSSQEAKRSGTNTLIYVYLVHVFFSVAYYLYSLVSPSDATGYYKEVLHSGQSFNEFNTGTKFIIFLITPLIGVLKMSLLNLYFLFCFIGYIGHVLFYKLLRKTYGFSMTILGQPLIVLILFLPGFHFWTSALGKDSLIFASLMMVFTAIHDLNKKYILGVIGLTLVACIRPHILMIILLTGAIVYTITVVKGGLNVRNIIVLFFFAIMVVISIPYFKRFVHIDSVNVEEVEKTFNRYNKFGTNKRKTHTSNIDVTNYSFPEKMFAYMYRPLFFDARTPMQLISSFENLLLLSLTYFWFREKKIRHRFRRGDLYYKFLTIYIFTTWLILAMGMYNLGLASRQKYMVLPAFFLLCFHQNSKVKQII